MKLIYSFENEEESFLFFHKVNKGQKSIRVYKSGRGKYIVSSPNISQDIVMDFLLMNIDRIINMNSQITKKYDDICTESHILFQGKMVEYLYKLGAYNLSYSYKDCKFIYSATSFNLNELRSCILNFYRLQVKGLIEEKVGDYSNFISGITEKVVNPNKIVFRTAKSRWGSCSSTATLSFNIMCAALPVDCLNYIIAHELCHLIHLNHSKNFKDLLSNVCKTKLGRDREGLEQELKSYGNLLRL